MALKLQSATGIEALSEKNVAAALKGLPGSIKSFIATHTFKAKRALGFNPQKSYVQYQDNTGINAPNPEKKLGHKFKRVTLAR